MVLSAYNTYATWRASRAAQRQKMAAEFDAEYGNAIRDALRSLRVFVGALRHCPVASNGNVQDLRADVEEAQASCIRAAEVVLGLLAETDEAVDLLTENWEAAFRDQANRAEAAVYAALATKPLTKTSLGACAAAASDLYTAGAAIIHRLLREEREERSRLDLRRKKRERCSA